jgi:hypothetical protein
MVRLAKILLALASIAALSATAALGASVHFKGTPTFTGDNTLTLTSTGSLAGLGNGDIVVTLTASGTPTVTCTSPGGNEAPGQNPGEVTVSGVQFIPSAETKNGNVAFRVSTSAPADPTGKEGGCPNNNWDAEITSIDFSTATITVYQPCTDTSPPISCPVVLSQTFTP